MRSKEKVNEFSKIRNWKFRSFVGLGISITSVFLATFLITGTVTISIAISTLATSIPFLINRQRALKHEMNRDKAWPEALDSLVSALQSGIAVPEALVSLATRGPEPLKPLFQRIERELQSDGDFTTTLLRAKTDADSAIADQVFETLIFTKDFGGHDANSALRLLADFIREDLAVIEEIRTKFGWVKNSAILATAAPWLLLLLLSTQESTREAFSSGPGVQILIVGVMMTAIAYFWMEKVGTLPAMNRALK